MQKVSFILSRAIQCCLFLGLITAFTACVKVEYDIVLNDSGGQEVKVTYSITRL